MIKWSAEIMFLTLGSIVTAAGAGVAPPTCGVTVIQGEAVALDQPNLPPNFPRLSGAVVTSAPAGASLHSDVPVITGAASLEAIQQGVSISVARYPKAKPVLVRSDPIAEKTALASSRPDKFNDVPIIESAPSSAVPCH